MTKSEFKTYLFSYQYEGTSWVTEIKATSPEDARRRMARLQYATYDGEVTLKVKVPTFIERAAGAVLRLLNRLIPSRSDAT